MKYLKSIREFLLESKSSEKKDKLEKEISTFKEKLREKDILKDDNFDDIIKILERDCSTFIREIKDTKSILFRGFKKIGSPHIENEDSIPGLYKKERKRNRSPLDIKQEVSDDLDNHFLNEFGFKLRSDGVFTTKCPFTASGYSDSPISFKEKKKVYIFFPIGDYEYYWNPDIKDLFSYIEDQDWYLYYNESWARNEGIENSYNHYYGDPRYNYVDDWGGNFELNGVKIPYDYDVIDYIMNNYKDFGLEKPKDGKIKIGDSYIDKDTRLKQIKELNWIPNITLEEFIKNLDLENEIKPIASGYKTGDIEDVVFQEVTFDCDNYYLIEEDYYFKLLEYLEK